MLLDNNVYSAPKLRETIVPVRELNDIAAINKLQIHNAANAVYFSDGKYSLYVSNLWKNERDNLFDHKGNVIDAQGVDENGQPMGDITHFFEGQLPYIPNFNFLKYQEPPEGDYRYSLRGSFRL